MTEEEKAGSRCPGCQQEGLVLPGAGQAFCRNEECHMVTWNPQKTLTELHAELNLIELPDWLAP